MSFLIYCVDPSTHPRTIPDFDQKVPVTADSLPAAITAACSFIDGGTIVWKIKGSNGFLMERSDIEMEFERRRVPILSPEPAKPVYEQHYKQTRSTRVGTIKALLVERLKIGVEDVRAAMQHLNFHVAAPVRYRGASRDAKPVNSSIETRATD